MMMIILLHELTYTFEFMSSIVESCNITAVDGFVGEDGFKEADSVFIVIKFGLITTDVAGWIHMDGLQRKLH